LLLHLLSRRFSSFSMFSSLCDNITDNICQMFWRHVLGEVIRLHFPPSVHPRSQPLIPRAPSTRRLISWMWRLARGLVPASCTFRHDRVAGFNFLSVSPFDFTDFTSCPAVGVWNVI
jgi:hypothetical protein